MPWSKSSWVRPSILSWLRRNLQLVICLDNNLLSLKSTYLSVLANKFAKEWELSVRSILRSSPRKRIIQARTVAWTQAATTPTSSRSLPSESRKFPKEKNNFSTNSQPQGSSTYWESESARQSKQLLLTSVGRKRLELLSARNSCRRYWASSMFTWKKWWKRRWMKLSPMKPMVCMKIWFLGMSITEQQESKLWQASHNLHRIERLDWLKSTRPSTKFLRQKKSSST